MSFLEDVRTELAGVLNTKPCCPAWELQGLLEVSGQAGNSRVRLGTDSAVVARRAYALLRDNGAERVRVTRRPKGGFVVTAYRPPEAAGPGAAGSTAGDATALPALPRNRCCRRAYLRGAFLGRGFLNATSHGYHWEVKTPGEAQAERLRRVMEGAGLKGARTGRWQKSWVAYLKDAEDIAAWLGLAGAVRTLLDFENTRVAKEMRNKVNRRVNYETANLSRTVAAALRQKESIRFLDRTVGLASLEPGLRALAEARLAEPLASLAELAAALKPPLSKSGASHRMRQIMELADRVRADQARRRRS